MDMDMDAFEARLAALTSNRAILGAIGHVVDKSGRVLYSRAAGPAALPSPSAQTTGEGGGEGAPALTADNILSLGSAGKFVYHVAALQCVEDGLLTLDEPIGTHIPELDRLLRIIPDDKTAGGFSLRAPLRRITLRHLLTHTSGIGESPLVDLWEKSGGSFVAETASRPIKMFSTPLVADPGEHFEYGNANVFWVSLLPSRLMPDRYPRYGEYLDARIVKPMGLTSVTPNPATDPERAARMLQAVARSSAGDGRVDETGAAGADDDAAKGVDGGLQQSATPPPPLVPAPPHFAVGLACSTTDLAALLVDLVSDAPRLLPTRAAADLLLAPAFPLPPASSAAADSAGESTPFEDAAARSFRAWAMREDMLSHAGVTRSCDASAQNWTLAGAWRGDGDGDGLGGVPPGPSGGAARPM
ncbi:beta-lactamase/transpeptidase-like protein [Zopfochytrium polystomum]|nr:beta-lactamase/transpeptidase-like protein [Zopfochytrium polystomum]